MMLKLRSEYGDRGYLWTEEKGIESLLKFIHTNHPEPPRDLHVTVAASFRY